MYLGQKFRWQFILASQKDIVTFSRGWRQFSLGVVKLTKEPPRATVPTKEHYKGFMIRFYFWLPYERSNW